MDTETSVGIVGEDGRIRAAPVGKHDRPLLAARLLFYLMYVNGLTWTFIYSSFGIIAVCMNENEP